MGLARRVTRLDRCLANRCLANPLWSSFSCRFSLLFWKKKNQIFIFDNFWLDYPKCHRIINRLWKSNANCSPLYAFTHSVNCTKTKLIHWRSTCLNYLDINIRDTELRIKELEGSDSIVDHVSLDSCNFHVLYNRHKALLHQNSLKWAQLSRLMWVQNGDFKSSFFHNSASIHRHKN